jgi:hypothetical protein
MTIDEMIAKAEAIGLFTEEGLEELRARLEAEASEV